MLRSRILTAAAVTTVLIMVTFVTASPSASQTLRVSETIITQGDSVTFTATQCGGGLGGDYRVSFRVTAPDEEVQVFSTQQSATMAGVEIPMQTYTIGSNAETVPGLHTVESVCEFIELGSSVLHVYPTTTINILAAVPDDRFDITTPLDILPDTGDAGAGGSNGAGGAGGSGGSSGQTIGFTG